jgi:NADP-dependent 3-hydroxy acid dehydrogenase YdfG
LSADLKESVIYITGATAGIGYATAQLCLERGASVVITGRNKDRLSEAESNLLKISSSVVAHNIDVSDESQVTKSLKDTYDAFGK